MFVVLMIRKIEDGEGKKRDEKYERCFERKEKRKGGFAPQSIDYYTKLKHVVVYIPGIIIAGTNSLRKFSIKHIIPKGY